MRSCRPTAITLEDFCKILRSLYLVDTCGSVEHSFVINCILIILFEQFGWVITPLPPYRIDESIIPNLIIAIVSRESELCLRRECEEESKREFEHVCNKHSRAESTTKHYHLVFS